MTRLFICGSGLTKTIGAIKEFPTKAIWFVISVYPWR
jgi:hypothetical protein